MAGKKIEVFAQDMQRQGRPGPGQVGDCDGLFPDRNPEIGAAPLEPELKERPTLWQAGFDQKPVALGPRAAVTADEGKPVRKSVV